MNEIFSTVGSVFIKRDRLNHLKPDKENLATGLNANNGIKENHGVMNNRLKIRPNSLVKAMFFMVFLAFGPMSKAAEIQLATVTDAGTTFRVLYDDSYNRIVVKFNTGTYQCGTSIWTRPFTLVAGTNQIATGVQDLNGGNKSLSYTAVTNPTPNTEYAIKLKISNSGKGTCSDKDAVVFDKTLKVTVNGMNGLTTSMSGTTLTASWAKGLIAPSGYDLILEGKSISEPSTGYQTIETKTISKSALSTSFTELYPGIAGRVLWNQIGHALRKTARPGRGRSPARGLAHLRRLAAFARDRRRGGPGPWSAWMPGV
jgi:hypothetical protein